MRWFSRKSLVWALALTGLSTISTPVAQAAPCVSSTSSFTGDGTNGLVNAVYTVHTFTSVTSCDWTVPSSVSQVDALIVGGGGGGASWVGAGGGAGAMIDTASISVTPSSVITIVVGSGGQGAITSDRAGLASRFAANGSSSSFGAISAAGGGRGGQWDQAAGTGGSGGGGAGSTGATAGTASNALYGFAGGAPNIDYNYGYPTGGGGGAGAVGAAGIVTTSVSGKSGNGGIGKISRINGSATYYAGGGGGGCHGNGGYVCNVGSGGLGGGGAGDGWFASDTIVNGADGVANTGGGGGGSGGPHVSSGTSSQGGNGGSGVVIVRYISDVTSTPSLGAGRINQTTVAFRTNTQLQMNLPISGKITFLQFGKQIPGCRNLQLTAGVTTNCQWKPMTRGFIPVTAIVYQSGVSAIYKRIEYKFFSISRSGVRQ